MTAFRLVPPQNPTARRSTRNLLDRRDRRWNLRRRGRIYSRKVDPLESVAPSDISTCDRRSKGKERHDIKSTPSKVQEATPSGLPKKVRSRTSSFSHQEPRNSMSSRLLSHFLLGKREQRYGIHVWNSWNGSSCL